MALNKTKKFKFSAFQLDLHYRERELDAITWRAEFIWSILSSIFTMNAQTRKKIFGDEWFMVLEDLQQDDKFVYGKFKSADFGTIGRLVHADTLATRDNPKSIREGEEKHTHFMIRKSDGFMLFQNHLRLSRAKFVQYLDDLGEGHIKKSMYTNINVCSLISLDLLEELRKLDKVKSTVIEISAKEKSDENDFIQEVQDEVDEVEATHVSLEFKAKWIRSGLGKIIPFIQKYKGKKGVTSIKIIGDQDGVERRFNVDTFSEKYTLKVDVDSNNNPMSENLYDKLMEVARKRDPVIRGE